MNYKVIIKSGDITNELSKDDIDKEIKSHGIFNMVKFVEYLLDEEGNMCGIKGIADLGHGYGFENGWDNFELNFGEQYSFEHEYTSIDGPSDWYDDSFKVVLSLIKLED